MVFVYPPIYYGIWSPCNLSWNMSCWKRTRSSRICVRPISWRWAEGKFWETMKPIHSPPCRTPCRLFIHEVLCVTLRLHLCVRSELGRSPPFRPMRALRLQWSRAFSLVCEVALELINSSFGPKPETKFHLHLIYNSILFDSNSSCKST